MATSALVFSISPSRKTARKTIKDEERYMLILAPFNKAPKINLGQLNLNQSVEKSLVIVNPQDFTLKLNIKNTDLSIDNLEVEIERQGNIEFKIKWQPDKAGNYKFMITFEVLNSRLKFIVHAFGICVEAPKKKVFKNLTILQPIRTHIKSTTSINRDQKPQVIIGRLQNKKKDETNKENQSTKVQQKTAKSKEDQPGPPCAESTYVSTCAESTYVIENSIESFDKIISHIKNEALEEQQEEESNLENYLQRRQTESIKTPQIQLKKFHFNFNEINPSHTCNDYFDETIISSASVANIYQACNLDLQTPKYVQQKLRRSISHSNLTTPTLTNNLKIDLIDQSITPKYKLNFNDEETAESKTSELLPSETTLEELRRKHATSKIQRAYKKYKKRLNEIKLKNEKKSRVEETRRKHSSIKIQRFYRKFKAQQHQVKLENEKMLRIEEARKKYSSIKIQRFYRKFKAQQFQRENELKAILSRKFAARKILRAYRAYKERVFARSVQKFVENRAARVIQKHVKMYQRQKKMIESSNTIKRYWRRHKFKKSMEFYRNAIVKIQGWTRSMKDRFSYLNFKRTVIFVQIIYKRKFSRRNLAALKIQTFYRQYKFRMFEYDRSMRLNYAATLIQSLWRGYVVRKEINLIQLRSIRERLSTYIQNSHSNTHYTLGYRIRRSLDVLEQKSPQVTQVILALLDFQVVTRLSRECCIQFLKAGAISALYEFIQSCNRSTPHTDLIKLCLEVFINLSKCDDTCGHIVDLDEKSKEVIHSNGLTTLLALLQSFHLSNAHVFMHVCVLLIILASNEKLEGLRACLLQQVNLKKLLLLYSTLERRSNLKLKNKRISSVLPSSTQDVLNDSVSSTSSISSISTANCLIQKFSLEPDWSLSKKSFIQLNDPQSALYYLLVDTLKVKVQNCGDVACGYRTPNKQMPASKSVSSVKRFKQNLEKLNEKSNESTKSLVKPNKSSVANKGVVLNDTNVEEPSMFFLESKDVDLSSNYEATSTLKVNSCKKAKSVKNLKSRF